MQLFGMVREPGSNDRLAVGRELAVDIAGAVDPRSRVNCD